MRLFNTSLNLPRGVAAVRALTLQSVMIAAFTAVTTAALTACGQATGPYDLVINQGRVIDPESGLDAARSVGIRDGKIVAISEASLDAKQVVDASGLVVSPGFINLHSHSLAEPGYRLELLDGVTTVLELEAGNYTGSGTNVLTTTTGKEITIRAKDQAVSVLDGERQRRVVEVVGGRLADSSHPSTHLAEGSHEATLVGGEVWCHEDDVHGASFSSRVECA